MQDPLTKKPRGAPRKAKLKSPESVNAVVKAICDIMRRSNCAGALQYVPELTWILFLRILDEREAHEADEAAALGLPFVPSLVAPFRWRDWAAPDSPRRQDKDPGAGVWTFVHAELLPHLKQLKSARDATPRQKVISEIMAGVDRSRVDSEKNFCDILDKVHQISAETVDHTHVFTLSQVYEGLLLKRGERATTAGNVSPRAKSSASWCAWWIPRSARPCTTPVAATGAHLRGGRASSRAASEAKHTEVQALEQKWKSILREACNAQSEAQTIEDAIYDLKAVNSNRVNETDTRTPGELLDAIAAQGREADAALERLRGLLGVS